MFLRIWTLIIKELRQLSRSKLLMPLILVAPVIEVALIAWATSAEITNLSTAVVDLDRSAESRALLTTLHNTDTFEFTTYLDSSSHLPAYIESGQALVGIVIPADYSERLANPGRPPEVALIVDGADPVSGREALNAAQGAVNALNQTLALRRTGGEEATTLVQPRLRVRYNEEMKEAVYTLPSEVGLVLFAVVHLLAAIAIARERELGTLEQLTVTPLRRAEIIIAKSVPVILLTLLVFLGLLAVTVFLFDVPMRGSWSLMMAVALFFILVELGFGLMISAYAKTQVQGLLLAFSLTMVEFFFSGYGVPVANMPELLQRIAPAFSIYHFMIIFRAILLKGVGLMAFWSHMLTAFLIGLVSMSIAIWLLGRQRWE